MKGLVLSIKGSITEILNTNPLILTTMSVSARKIISVGGSIIIPKTGFDISLLKKFRALILDEVKKGTRFILVIGGGATCRAYQQAALKVVKMTSEDLDWIGIHTTIFNAEFVRFLFKEHAHDHVIRDPEQQIKTNKPIIIGAGFKPGHSTDMDAVLLARQHKATDVINLSNIDYIYDKDPNKYSDAKRIERITWTDFRKRIVGSAWRPGTNVPFDPIASKEAERRGLRVSIVNGTNITEVKRALQGKKFAGTIIY